MTALGSCKKNNPAPDNFIFYKVDGVYKTARPEGDLFGQDGLLIESGSSLKNEIDLFTDQPPQVGVYHLDSDMNGAAAQYYDSNGVSFWSDSGKLVINAYDGHHIKGSFSFRGRTLAGANDTTRITEGQFSTSVEDYGSIPDSCAICDSTMELNRRASMARHLTRVRIGVAHP